MLALVVVVVLSIMIIIYYFLVYILCVINCVFVSKIVQLFFNERKSVENGQFHLLAVVRDEYDRNDVGG